MLIRMQLSLPRDARYVPVIRNVAGCVLSDLGAPPEARDDVQIALTEACANAVRHAVGSEEYSVSVAVADDACEIEVVDLGPGFDPSVGEGPGPDWESGRGLFLIRALVDDFEFVRRDDSTRVRLTKRWEGVGLRLLASAVEPLA